MKLLMKLKKNWKIYILLILLITTFIFSITLVSFNPFRREKSVLELELSIKDTGAIPYGDYIYEQHHASQSLDWRFESSKNYIGIRVLLMESNYFYNFQHGMGYAAFILSGGEHSQDAGRYELPLEDNWVVVFQNLDSDQELAIVSYELIFDEIDPFTIVSSIMAFSIVFGVISIIIYIIKKKDRDV